MTATVSETITPAKYHSSMGFPHLNRNTGACMCFMSCCWGASGCRCKTGCSGAGHSGCGSATEGSAAVPTVLIGTTATGKRTLRLAEPTGG